MEFPQKLIDNLLGLFDVKGKSTTNGVKIQQVLKYVNQTRDYVYIMEPQLPTADSQGLIPAEIVSFSDSDWAGCQKSRRSTSGSLITLFSVNLSSTSRTHASVSHSSAEAELYAMTQASVDSLAMKHFINELKSEILSRDVKSTLKTDSSAGKTMASRLGISKRSKHIELKHLWIQDILSDGVMSLEKVGTHNNPSDIQASVLGNHLPKLNLFKASSISQVFRVSSVVRVHGLQSHRGSHAEDQILARLHQVCAQHQGQVCMINFEAFQGQQDLVIQRFKSASRKRFKSASRRIQRAFTPPPSRRGSENQDSSHSDVQMQIQENHVIQNASATSRWWMFIAFIMSVMHFMVQGYLTCDVQESQAAHSHVNKCQSGICHYHYDHQPKEKTGSKKESIETIKADETVKTSVSQHFYPVQCSICYLYSHCLSFHVTQSIIISIILLDSRLELSRGISLSSVASVVSSSCHFHLKNGSSTSASE